ncbi:MAG TPA: trypsin-like peptidase domain-containing protein [Acidimicrobiia bacterium]
MDPLLSIGALVLRAAPDSEEVDRYCGTAFYFRDNRTMITAAHVLREQPDLDIDHLAAIITIRDEFIIVPVRRAYISRRMDLAVLAVEPVDEVIPLTTVTERPALNEDLSTLEFAASTHVRVADERRAFKVDRSFRKGHAIRWYTSDFPETVPTRCVDLSYPALKGASGAPVT